MMGLDAPTTTCVSSATSSSNFSLQQTSFVDTFTNVDSSKKDSEKEKEQQHKQILATTSSSISGHSSTFVQSTNVDCGGQQQNDDITSDNFPEDLSGLDGISPIVDLSLTGNGRAQNSGGNCNAKVEFFGFGPTSLATPASTNGHHHPQQQLNVLYSQQNLLQQQQFNGPGSAPAGPSCCSSADSGHHSAGGSVPGGTSVDFFRCPSSSSSSNLLNHCHQNIDQQQKLIIRNPFAPEYPPKAFSQISNLSPLNGHHQHFCDQQQLLQPVMQPLNWDGKPPNDSKCMAELARLADADPLKPPMVPLPNVKEGGIPHGGVFPQWSFFNMPFQRQRLEQLYPDGTFSSAHWSRWSSMPMPMLRPVIPMPPSRMVLMCLRPGTQVPPGMIPPWLAGRIPAGTIPMFLAAGPNGQPVTVPFNNTIHPSMLVPPGGLPPNQVMAPQQIQANNYSSLKQQCDANTASLTTAVSSTPLTTTKPKKETAKQRKQREREEQLRREQDVQQTQQTNFTSATGRSPMDGVSGQTGSSPFFGHIQMQQQMLHGLQQDACFKVPGRSPPIRSPPHLRTRCTSSFPASVPPGSAPPAPTSLTPMPDQRIHAQGQCFVCQTEINHQHKAIQCTAISQGCNQLFHWDCACLSPEAFAEFCRDSRLEWICLNCFSLRSKEQCLMFAC